MADHVPDLTPDLSRAPHAQALPALVRRFERQLDEAYATFGELAAALPRARLELALSAVVGHQALAHFSDAGTALVAARGHSVSGHRLIDKVALALNIETAAGDERPKPNDPPPQRFFTGAEIAAPQPVA
jgi:hypothetical protein